MHISISEGNSKLGKIASVSLPAGVACRQDCECLNKCYARKIMRIRKSVRNAYERNWEILQNDPFTYWREIEMAVAMSRFFRFHVSGDIPDEDYLWNMIRLAETNKHCEILCFTKKYEIVNEMCRKFKACGYKDQELMPRNLRLIFSGWRGLEMQNPYNFPEAHVRYKDGTTTARADAKECGENCTDCALAGEGCWTLKHGEQIVFKEH